MNMEKDTQWNKITQDDFDKYIANETSFTRKAFGDCFCYYRENGERFASRFNDGECFTKYMFWLIDA